MKEALKVKVISLSDEARTIRRLEQRELDKVYNNKDPDVMVKYFEKRVNRYHNSSNFENDFDAPYRFDYSERELERWKRKAKNALAKQNANTYNSKYYNLHTHRKGIVAFEARHTHLAYGFLLGIPYHSMERDARFTPDWDKVFTMVKKYGDKDDLSRWDSWLQIAKGNSVSQAAA